MPRVGGMAVPTGPALLALIKWAGEQMHVQPDHAAYLQWREWYLMLLEAGEKDPYCVEILIPIVQALFDEEHRRHRG
jgi:hypothetical protein